MGTAPAVSMVLAAQAEVPFERAAGQ